MTALLPASTTRTCLGHERGATLSSLAVVVVACALLAALTGAVAFHTGGNWRAMETVAIGAAIGATLLLTNFGFAGAFRTAVQHGDFNAFRAHAVMLGIGSALMVPAIAAGSVFGQPMSDFATPIGPSFVLGAVLFGCGMQMAGGCASGTLFMLGGGNLKYLLTLIVFVLGSTVGAAHMGFWRSLPAIAPVTVFSLGWWPAVLTIELAALALLWRFLPHIKRLPPRLATGAVLLAVLNFTTLLAIGHPWSETLGFTLWGSKIAAGLGFEPAHWSFWESENYPARGVFTDVTSIMDLAIVLGAAGAAASTGRTRWTLEAGWRNWVAAGLGGFLMGYGARLSDGCNIGAYFSAVVSGSFSGYAWALAALCGSMLGIRLRSWHRSNDVR